MDLAALLLETSSDVKMHNFSDRLRLHRAGFPLYELACLIIYTPFDVVISGIKSQMYSDV